MSSLELLRTISPTVSAGILSANLMSLSEEVDLLTDAGVRLLHFDVMDGQFTPALTVGPPFIRGVKTRLLKDVHLMVQEPLEKVDAYVAAGADLITVHAESTTQVHALLVKLAQLENANDPSRGIIRGLALNPGTALSVLEPLLEDIEMVLVLGVNPSWMGSFLPATYARLARVKEMIAASGKEILLAVDGGIKRDHFPDLARTGADIIVTGSAIFNGDARKNVKYMLQTLKM